MQLCSTGTQLFYTCQEQFNNSSGLETRISRPSCRTDFVTFALVVASCATPQECTVVPFVFIHLFTIGLALTFCQSDTLKWHNRKSKQNCKTLCLHMICSLNAACLQKTKIIFSRQKYWLCQQCPPLSCLFPRSWQVSHAHSCCRLSGIFDGSAVVCVCVCVYTAVVPAAQV